MSMYSDRDSMYMCIAININATYTLLSTYTIHTLLYTYTVYYIYTYSKIPKLHQSTEVPYFWLFSSSGAMYSAVPQKVVAPPTRIHIVGDE